MSLQRMLTARDRIVDRCRWFETIVDKAKLIEFPLGLSLMGTDGGDHYFDPKVMRRFDQYIEGCLLHEYLHCLGDHIGRRRSQGRDPGLWNVAADYAINPLVIKLFDMPASATLLDANFIGMQPEAIYDKLKSGKTGQHWPTTASLTVFNGIELPPDLSGKPLQRARKKWRDAVAAAGEPPEFLKGVIAGH